jgi:hypothetical protein
MNHPKASSLRAARMDTMSRFAGSQPLALRDGGMFDGIKRALGVGPAETMTQKFARQDAEFQARNPAPAASASAPQPKAISEYAGNPALDRRMKAAGLRNGGDLRTGHGGAVPGTGRGDKVPAKYEPGEFVVSNDMLDAQPELRQHLRGLREAVLANKGMTPEQADAKAMSGGTLRAENAFDGSWKSGPWNQAKPEDLAGEARRQAEGRAAARAADAAKAAADQAEAAKAAAAKPAAAAATPTPETARQRAAAYNPKISIPVPELKTVVKATEPWVRRGGKAVAGINAVVDAGDVLDVATDKNMNGGDVATEIASKGGRWAAAGVGAAAGGALGSMPVITAPVTGPLGALVGGTLGYLGGGAAIKGLRGLMGMETTDPSERSNGVVSQALDRGRGDAPVVASAPAAQAPYNPNQTEATRLRTHANLTQGNAGRGAGPDAELQHASRDMTNELSGRPGGRMQGLPSDLREGVVHKTVDAQGRVTYSGRNVGQRADGSTQMVDGTGRDLKMRGSLEVAAPGSFAASADGKGYAFTPVDKDPKARAAQLAAGNAQIQQTLTNPDGSRWSAGDSATMAANLRDGIDPYRGTSRQPAQSQGASIDDQLQAAMAEYADPDRERAPGRGKALRTKIETLRGLSQDASVAGAARDRDSVTRAGNEASAKATALRDQQEQANKDRTYQLDVAKFGVETANKNRDDVRAREEAFDRRIEGISAPGDAPAVRAAVNGYLASQEAKLVEALRKNPNNRAVASELAGLRQNGRAGISDPLLRQLAMGIKANTVARDGAGSNSPFNPWDGTSVNTNQPVTSLTPDKSFTSRFLPGAGKYVTDNGQKILKSDVDRNPDLRELIR